MIKRIKSVLKETKKLLKSKKGFFVDTGILILISVVLGSLLLGGLYTLANDTVFPSTKEKIESMFEYSGGNNTAAQLKGDINKDGVVDITDQEILNSEIASLSGEYDIADLDLNEDGQVSMMDLVRIKKIIAANEAQ